MKLLRHRKQQLCHTARQDYLETYEYSCSSIYSFHNKAHKTSYWRRFFQFLRYAFTVTKMSVFFPIRANKISNIKIRNNKRKTEKAKSTNAFAFVCSFKCFLFRICFVFRYSYFLPAGHHVHKRSISYRLLSVSCKGCCGESAFMSLEQYIT